jgi:2-polyprenyl-3-methyl-5-hydroxy-6-metoxy-1,4-benzoquinol methylase
MCKDKKTLDIGCSGYSNKFSIHNQLKELNLPLLVGIDNQNITDISNNLIQCDIQKFSDVTALLQKFGPFERIVMLEVIEHIGNVYDTVINLSRLLKTNGIIVISTPNAISDK